MKAKTSILRYRGSAVDWMTKVTDYLIALLPLCTESGIEDISFTL